MWDADSLANGDTQGFDPSKGDPSGRGLHSTGNPPPFPPPSSSSFGQRPTEPENSQSVTRVMRRSEMDKTQGKYHESPSLHPSPPPALEWARTGENQVKSARDRGELPDRTRTQKQRLRILVLLTQGGSRWQCIPYPWSSSCPPHQIVNPSPLAQGAD